MIFAKMKEMISRLKYIVTKDKEIILGVAIRRKLDNRLWCLPAPNRHHNLIRIIYEETGQAVTRALYEQGFYTNKQGFIDRYDALKVAKASGQLKNRSAIQILFSEDMW